MSFFNITKFLLLMTSLVLSVSCTTVTEKKPKSKWKVMGQEENSNQNTSFVPSGTELIFTADKKFTSTDKLLNIEVSKSKRCVLTTNVDTKPEIELKTNTVLTVVGYRGETDELVLSESTYNQYFMSCLKKVDSQKRTTSSKAKKTTKPTSWQKSAVEIDDLKKMSPLFQIKFLPL